MSLLYKENINEQSTVAIWCIEEPESFFLEKVRLKTEIAHPHKRLQHLAGRYVLQMLDPEMPVSKIIQEQRQKPYLRDTAHEFSISHCGDFAAAILSSEIRVGLDIETFKPKITDIVHKFLTEKEREILLHHLPDPLHAFTLGWSIKEALFKWLGQAGIDFNKHLHIESIYQNEDRYSIECTIDKEEKKTIVANGFFIEEMVVVWVQG